MTGETRRQLMTGSLAALGAAGAPAIAADDHDRAEWLALWRTFIEAERVHDETATSENEGELCDVMIAAKDAIADRPAISMIGLAVKLATWVHHDGTDWRKPASLDDVNDHREGIEAYRDAARLASLPEDFWRGKP